MFGKQPRERGRPVAVRRQRQHPCARLQMRTDEIERAAMERELRRFRQRPAQARGGEAEGRRLRHRHGFARVDMPQQHRADAVNERVARGENADLPAAIGQHLLDRALERAGPRPRRAADERCGQAEMPLAAEHDLRVLRPVRARRAVKSLEPVLADADDGQPAAGCGRLARKGVTRRHATHPHSRRHDGGATAGGAARRSRRPGRHGLARGQHHGACDASRAGADRRLRRRPGPRRLSHGRTRPACSSTPPTLTPPTSRRTPPRPQPSRACPCSRCAGHHGYRAPATTGPRLPILPAAVQALGPSPRRVFLALGRNEIGCFAQAPQHAYLVRSVEPVDPPLAVPHASYVTGRGPFTEADDRGLLRTHAIDIVVAKNSGGTATYGKIAAARALGVRGDHAAPSRFAGGADRRDRR